MTSRIRRPALLGALAFAVTAAMLAACAGLMGLAHARTGPVTDASLASNR